MTRMFLLFSATMQTRKSPPNTHTTTPAHPLSVWTVVIILREQHRALGVSERSCQWAGPLCAPTSTRELGELQCRLTELERPRAASASAGTRDRLAPWPGADAPGPAQQIRAGAPPGWPQHQE